MLDVVNIYRNHDLQYTYGNRMELFSYTNHHSFGVGGGPFLLLDNILLSLCSSNSRCKLDLLLAVIIVMYCILYLQQCFIVIAILYRGCSSIIPDCYKLLITLIAKYMKISSSLINNNIDHRIMDLHNLAFHHYLVK